jgi:hypothetical protein
MRADRVHRVTVALDDCPTRRVVDVADTTTLAGLHRVVLAAMGWSGAGSHAWFVDGRHVDAEAESTWLTGALVGRRAAYRYGEMWEHSVHVAPGQRPSALPYPMLLAAEAACPPEECPGPAAYRRAVTGVGDWRLPDGFDPDRASLRAAAARVAAVHQQE